MRDKIYDQLKNMDDYDVMRAWNHRCDVLQYMDDYMYDMGSFDELMCDEKPINVASFVFYGDFNPHNEFFTFNALGNLLSFGSIHHFVEIEQLADDIAHNHELREYLINVELLEVPEHD
tara:strand:- start:1155 stop:1511 length:357 start_codon:yes stop_codon:yes gene_type:complete